MILTERVAADVASGEVAVAFRRWAAPRVNAGDTFLSSAGVIAITTIEKVGERVLTDHDAHQAGLASLQALRATFRGRESDPVYRIGLTWAGPDPREQLSADTDLTDADLEAITDALDRMDRRRAWTRTILREVRDRPGRRAADLAAANGFDKEVLKRDIRKLKDLGLTKSLNTGYVISPRGVAYLDRHEPLFRDQKRERGC